MSIAYQRFVIDELPKGPRGTALSPREACFPRWGRGRSPSGSFDSPGCGQPRLATGRRHRGVETGDVMPSGAIAEVLASEDSAFAPGNWSTAISAGKATRSWQGPRSTRSAPTAP